MKIMRSPREISIEVTSNCNLRCSYCYYFDNPDQKYIDLPVDEWVHFIEEAGRSQVMNIVIAGGEPFFRKDLNTIIHAIVKNKMRFVILSNGALITDKIAEFIASTKRCDAIQISLDGSSPETHDIFRGKGSFKKAVNGIKTLQKFGINVTVRLTIHHHNVNDLDAAAEFLLEKLKLPTFSTNSAAFFGSCKIHADEIRLTVEDRFKAMKTLLDLTKKYPGRISAQAGPLADAVTWKRMEEARIAGAKPFPMGGRLTGCGCIFNKLSVRSDGTYIPCAMMPHVELGKINEDSLLDVWLNANALNVLRKRPEIKLKDLKFCEGCPYTEYCTGNCPALAYSLVGDLNQPSPVDCLRNYLAEGGKLP